MSTRPTVVYHREPHAAHTSTGQGWDLEKWDVVQAWNDPRPTAVPSDANKHTGHLGDGVQHVVYVRRAPLTGPCGPFCPIAA